MDLNNTYLPIVHKHRFKNVSEVSTPLYTQIDMALAKAAGE
jgi:hypothetical protein